jgi:hypothetical protein
MTVFDTLSFYGLALLSNNNEYFRLTRSNVARERSEAGASRASFSKNPLERSVYYIFIYKFLYILCLY